MDEIKPDEIAALVVIEEEKTGEVDMVVEILVDGFQPAGPASLKTELAQVRAELEIAQLREEIERLKDRLAIFGSRARTTVTTQTKYVSASAHAQLGDYPWLKLAAAGGAAWVAGRLVRW